MAVAQVGPSCGQWFWCMGGACNEYGEYGAVTGGQVGAERVDDAVVKPTLGQEKAYRCSSNEQGLWRCCCRRCRVADAVYRRGSNWGIPRFRMNPQGRCLFPTDRA